MKQVCHIIPVGHPEPLHTANAKCWCQPLEIEAEGIAVHHAKDGREKWERQGITDSEKAWIHVYENIGP